MSEHRKHEEQHKPPAHLSRDAKEWWRRVLEEWAVETDGLLVLQVALEAYDRLCQAQRLITRDGLVFKTKSGPRAHPACNIEKEARLALLRAWRQLGLNIEPPGAPGRPPGSRGG